ncbi:MAG: endo-1,4-beta-xylanase [Eubacteriales bacterium]|nr:endo-1,4-beta-xylanase [Eubacteriales bacterium]
MSRRDTALAYFNEQKEFTDIRIKSGIELYRKGEMNITLKNPDLSITKDEITVEIEQINHEFKFGANIFMLDEFECTEKNEIYRTKFPELFNLATVPFYWNALEPVEGELRFSKDSPKIYRRPAPDLCIEYCKEKGIEPKCHCLNYDNFNPQWLNGATVSEHKTKLERRFREISERYARDIPSFEVTNETFQGGHSKFYLEDDYLEWSYKTADRYFPNNHLIINDDHTAWWPSNYTNRSAYFMQIERLLRNGITHLDAIGIQFHSFFSLNDERWHAAQKYNPITLYKLLDLYGRFGIPEQITEMTIPAYGDDEENESVQAELIRNIYSVFFSHPAMEAIIYWNLVDGYAGGARQGDMSVGENVYYGGLLRFDMSEKPAYIALRHLINEEWHTKETIRAIDGKLNFRGFYGDYKLKIYMGNKIFEKSCRLSKNAKNDISIIL